MMLDVFVYLAPVLALVVALLLGRYPGERALRRRLAEREPARRPPLRASVRHRATRTLLPRGGALLAYALAGRAPPTAAR